MEQTGTFGTLNKSSVNWQFFLKSANGKDHLNDDSFIQRVLAEGLLCIKNCSGALVVASMTEKGPRHLELHVKGDCRPSLVSGLSSHSQVLCLA